VALVAEREEHLHQLSVPKLLGQMVDEQVTALGPFSLLLGDHWRWLRKGLAYLTIGSRVGGCWRAKEKKQEGETATETWRGTE